MTTMDAPSSARTHDVTNQPPPLVGHDVAAVRRLAVRALPAVPARAPASTPTLLAPAREDAP